MRKGCLGCFFVIVGIVSAVVYGIVFYHEFIDVEEPVAPVLLAKGTVVRQGPSDAAPAADTVSVTGRVLVGVEEPAGWARVYAYASGEDMPRSISKGFVRVRDLQPYRSTRARVQPITAPRERFAVTALQVSTRPKGAGRVVRRVQPGQSLLVGAADASGYVPVYRNGKQMDTIGYAPLQALGGRVATSTRRAPQSSASARSPSPASSGRSTGPRAERHTFRLADDVFLSTSRDWWDDEHLMAVVPRGTTVRLLDRQVLSDVPGMAIRRCRIEVPGIGRGWVFCSDLT